MLCIFFQDYFTVNCNVESLWKASVLHYRLQNANLNHKYCSLHRLIVRGVKSPIMIVPIHTICINSTIIHYDSFASLFNVLCNFHSIVLLGFHETMDKGMLFSMSPSSLSCAYRPTVCVHPSFLSTAVLAEPSAGKHTFTLKVTPEKRSVDVSSLLVSLSHSDSL